MNRPFGLSNAALEKRLAVKDSEGWLPRGYIDGLQISNDTTDATNDIVISPGVCRSTVSIVDGTSSTLARDQRDIEIPVTLIKQLDVAWAPGMYDDDGSSGGGRSGGRSSSSVSDTTWHYFAIAKPGAPADILIHDSTALDAEMQKIGSYTACRRLGSITRESGVLIQFAQNGDEFLRNGSYPEISNTAPGTTNAVTLILAGAPGGIIVTAILSFQQVAAGITRFSALVQADEAPTSTNYLPNAGGAANSSERIHVRTNTSRQIRYRQGASAAISVGTDGWIDQREKNAYQ